MTDATVSSGPVVHSGGPFTGGLDVRDGSCGRGHLAFGTGVIDSPAPIGPHMPGS